MLEVYKERFAKPNIQYITLKSNGDILESDDVLISGISAKNIGEIHPFFESIIPILSQPEQDIKLSCIHIKQELVVDVSIKTFDDPINNPALIIVKDLTTYYENYQATTQLRNESIINSQILELKNSYLLEKEAFKNKFIANFSHVLRDPLTGILTFVDFLNKTNLDGTQLDYLSVIKSSSEFLKTLINNILDISKIEAGKLELILSPFNLIELLNELKDNYAIKAETKGLEFHFNFDESLPKIVEGDATRLRQMLSNLLDNAIKFTKQGSITLNASLNQVRAQKASIHFEVIDTGIGIKEENFEVIFESFKQLHPSSDYSGSGLGLSIVKRLLSLSNSEITVASEIGKGSTFSTNVNFKIPVLGKSASKQALKNNETSTVEHPNKKYNILLVESSDITQLAVLKILAAQGHYFLDIMSTGASVIEKIEQQEFDIILMEIELDDVKGDEITRQIRKLKDRDLKKIPVIGLATRVFKEDLRAYKKAGITDILKKPFDEDDLLNKLKEHLK